MQANVGIGNIDSASKISGMRFAGEHSHGQLLLGALLTTKSIPKPTP